MSSSNASGASAAPLRVDIAGLGFGGGVHLPVFRSLPGVEVSALLGRDAGKVGAMAERFGVPGACTSMDAFFDRPLDAVVISLPPEPAGRLAAAALDRGLAILAEKPIAATATEAEALAARTAGLTTMVDFEFRELPSFRALHALVKGGTLGRIASARIDWRASSYAQRKGLWSWKTNAAECGGVLTLSGMHLFNLLEWLFGPVAPEETRLSDAATRAFAPADGQPAADTADLLLRTADGTEIRAHLTNAAADRLGHRWEIGAEGGTLVLDDGGVGSFGGFSLSLRAAGGRRQLAHDPTGDGDYRIGPVAALAGRFVTAIRSGMGDEPDFAEGARAQRLMEQARAAA